MSINLVNWTVSVAASFDRKRFFDVQVGSPYMHFNNGEGLSIFPEIGAVCMVCVPGDSSPPFVMSFLMPHELVDGSADDAPLGTRPHGAPSKTASDSSFGGGRPRAKPGDIYLRTRDGNFLILHRGGVLQIGSTELAQRIYVPLGNLITDISGGYEHFNTGGGQVWGIQEGPSSSNNPAQHVSTYRVFANDQYADLKIAWGKVFNPMPDSDGGEFQAQADVGQDDTPILCEVSVSPKGFVVGSGDVASSATSKNSVLRFVFDRKGNTLLRCEGNLAIRVKKKVIIDVDDDINITGKSLNFTVKSGLDIDGGSLAHIKGDIVMLGPGQQPVARLGDAVSCFIAGVPCVFTPVGTVTPNLNSPAVPIPGVLTIPSPVGGYIATGQYTVKA